MKDAFPDPYVCAALFLTAGAAWMDLRSMKVDNGWLLFWLIVRVTLPVILLVIRAGPGDVVPGYAGSGYAGSGYAGSGYVGSGYAGAGFEEISVMLQILSETLAGMAVPLVLLFPFFYFRMLGAADIKLLAVLGSFLGRKAILSCTFYTFLCAAVLSLLTFLFDGGLQIRVRYLAGWLREYMETGQRQPYLRPGLREESLHMTIPMLMAVLLWAGGGY